MSINLRLKISFYFDESEFFHLKDFSCLKMCQINSEGRADVVDTHSKIFFYRCLARIIVIVLLFFNVD